MVMNVMEMVFDVVQSPDITQFTTEQVLQEAAIPSDQYNNCLAYSKSAATLVLKRPPAESNINNPELLRIWKAKMDLQFVCAPYVCISYIVLCNKG